MEKLGNYYNSELNEYIGKNLPKVMTSIDLDLLQVKKSRKIIRLAEYKHKSEKLGYQQEEALRRIAKIANVINKNSCMFDNWKMQVLLIKGNKPYDNIIVFDFITDREYFLSDKNKIDKFLTLEQL